MNENTDNLTLVQRLVDLDEPGVLSLVRERLQRDDDPLALLEECQMGMNQVGERYEQRGVLPVRIDDGRRDISPGHGDCGAKTGRAPLWQ